MEIEHQSGKIIRLNETLNEGLLSEKANDN